MPRKLRELLQFCADRATSLPNRRVAMKNGVIVMCQDTLLNSLALTGKTLNPIKSVTCGKLWPACRKGNEHENSTLHYDHSMV